jgi:hypothetical protein
MHRLLLTASILGLLTGCLPVPSGGTVPSTSAAGGGGTSSGSGPHLEAGGLVVVEAEHFTSADSDGFGLGPVRIPFNNRNWILQAGSQAGPTPDPDGYHGGASGDAYLECLPDTRVTHDDPFTDGSFYEDTTGAALHYEITFENAGTYYVWVRQFSTGTEDNGLHVGVDGDLSPSGQKMQWCGPNEWRWSNAQRDTGGTPCGVNGTIMVTVPSAGLHTISFYQREDGFEFDRFLMTTDAGFAPSGGGPVESPRTDPE